MRRLEVVATSFAMTNTNPPEYKALSFQVQVLRGQHDAVRAEFFVEGQELQEFLANGMDYEKLAEEKMRWILELNTTPVDAYMLETMQREQREILGSVEETKTAAIEAASAVAEQAAGALVEDVKTQAVTAATQAASAAVEEVKVQAVQAATQVADAQTAILRTAMRKFVRIDELQPEDIADLVGLYDPWTVDEAVAVGDIRSYEGKLYKVVQAHTTQADWTPDSTPALWTEIAPPVTGDGEEIVPDFVQPTGAHDAYKTGDRVLFEGRIYESTIDANTWSPSDYPQGWKEVTD